MPDLILRPSGLAVPKEWSLQLRYHDCCGPTDYRTLCYVDEGTAREVIQARGATWLFGEPGAAKPVERGLRRRGGRPQPIQ